MKNKIPLLLVLVLCLVGITFAKTFGSSKKKGHASSVAHTVSVPAAVPPGPTVAQEPPSAAGNSSAGINTYQQNMKTNTNIENSISNEDKEAYPKTNSTDENAQY